MSHVQGPADLASESILVTVRLPAAAVWPRPRAPLQALQLRLRIVVVRVTALVARAGPGDGLRPAAQVNAIHRLAGNLT